MSLIAKDSRGGDFELAPEGNHIARCYQVIDLGIQTGNFKGEEKKANKVLIGWELPMTLMEDGRPFVVSARYTISLHEKAHLRAQLQSWRGRSFTEDELGGFDIRTVLGVPCMVNVVHHISNGRTYANVTAVTPIPSALTCPPAVNAPIKYAIDESTEEEFQALPEWMRSTIKRDIAPAPAPVPQHEDFPDDDVPF